MSTVKGIDFLKQFLSPFLKGQNNDAIFGTFGDEDERLDDLSVAVTDQLTISTASEQYLDKRLADIGIVRPAELGMEDLAFRQMGIEINATHSRSVSSGIVTGTCRAIVLGRTLCTHEIEITDEEGRRLSTVRMTNMLRDLDDRIPR